MNDKNTIDISTIPAAPGIYVLIFSFQTPGQTIQIGKLGEFTSTSHLYCYIGSARGPGGLRSRAMYHLNQKRKPHWHIDWLYPYIEYHSIYFTTNSSLNECMWSQHLKNTGFTSVPLKKFGASDCSQGCPAHLYAITEKELAEKLSEVFQSSIKIEKLIA